MFERKRKTKKPCSECFLNQTLCICSLIPRFETRTRMTLIIHTREMKRTTNTGRLALKMLTNSAMVVRGASKEPVNLGGLVLEGYQNLLFFPTEDAVELSFELIQSFQKPIHFLIPDGNWRQASKVSLRHLELKDVPRVMISKENLSSHHLRKESSPEGMATLQAIAEAYRFSESEEVYEKIRRVYELKLEKTLLGRGIHFEDRQGKTKL